MSRNGRALRSSLCPLAASLVLLAASAPASVQTSVKLVGNTGLTNLSASRGNIDSAQSFTTGTNTAGYLLTRVDIRMLGGTGTAPTYTVSIRSDSSGEPGASLGTLRNPAGWPVPVELARHDAPSGGIALAANTTYWVVVDITANPY